MKYLIINADDFGNYAGINNGIIDGIGRGIITSTSLMVYRKHAKDIERIKSLSNISIGLHFELPKDKDTNIIDEFKKQLDIFVELVGRKPDHFDSHKVGPKDIDGLRDFLKVYSKENDMPIRGFGFANLIDKFFGFDYKSQSVDLNKVSPQTLIAVLNENLKDGYNELMCHAGFADDELRSSTIYSDAREAELNSLLSEEFRKYLDDNKDVKLVSWKEVKV